MRKPSCEHATFTIERHLKASVPRAFRAWSSPEAKRQWFACHDEWTQLHYALDFRPGGIEENRIADIEGVVHGYRAHYIDILPDARIVYSYEMKLGETRISVSLATVVFEAEADCTKMTFTEQVVFLDGYADNGSRLSGTEIGLERLQDFLAREISSSH